jgi:hypothetical protein
VSGVHGGGGGRLPAGEEFRNGRLDRGFGPIEARGREGEGSAVEAYWVAGPVQSARLNGECWLPRLTCAVVLPREIFLRNMSIFFQFQKWKNLGQLSKISTNIVSISLVRCYINKKIMI